MGGNIILYSNNCPKCKILKDRLDQKGLSYSICSDEELMISKGFRSMPILEVDGNVYMYFEAIKYIKEF